MTKALKSGQLGVAAGLLCSVFALSSCLLPQNDDPLPVIPPQKNRPPRLLRDRLDPAPPKFIHVFQDQTCLVPEVKAAVEDPDTGDLIRVKWTVYEADGTKALFQVDNSTLPSGQLSRSITAPVALFKRGSALFDTGGTKHLELIVADGELSTDSTGGVTTLPGEAPAPDGGTQPNPTYIDSYTWPVDTNAICP